jgi:uncharacterized protein YoxC
MNEKPLLIELIDEVKKTNKLLEEIRDSLSSMDSHVETIYDIALKLYRG